MLEESGERSKNRDEGCVRRVTSSDITRSTESTGFCSRCIESYILFSETTISIFFQISVSMVSTLRSASFNIDT